MKQKIKEFKNKIVDLIFPKNIKCMFCAEELNENEYNCTCVNCLDILPFINNPCLKCGAPMNENQCGVCVECKSKNLNFTQAKSVFTYENLVSEVVYRFKYSQKEYLAEHMVKYLVDVFATWNVFPNLITCVPLHPSKEKSRSFNQSKIMAKKFSEIVKVPYMDIVKKKVDTPSQTSLSTKERFNNVKDSFEILKESKAHIQGKTILIIDDVITTGATTSEMSGVMINAGAKECYVLSFAHAKTNQTETED